MNHPTKIIKIIDEAFKDTPYPGDDRLAGGAVHDHTNCPCESSSVANYFKGKHWRDITLKGLQNDYPGPHDACLSFMSTEAFRFYLPAYMIIAINEYEDADTAGDSALYALTPSEQLASASDAAFNPKYKKQLQKSQDLFAWWQERVSGFTPVQKKAIVAFLEYMEEAHGEDYPEGTIGPKQALEYWKTRKQGK